MGGTRWSDDAYLSRTAFRTATGAPVFTHDADIRSGRARAAVHDRLNPLGLKVRESRDSEAHPCSNAVIVVLDVTGSMGRVVGEIHAALPKLMGLLTRRNYLPDPQIMFSAIGDATCDAVPLQIGQFESGLEMEDDLTHFFIEQGGGGQNTESYELMAWVGAHKTDIDCFNKRGRKGYCFFIGDELPYGAVKKSEIQRLLGHGLQSDVPVKAVFETLQAKYHVFYVLPQDASNGTSAAIIKVWSSLIGAEHVLRLRNASGVSELIATQIGLVEEATDIDSVVDDMVEEGSTDVLARVVRDAVSPMYRGGVALTRVSRGALPPAGESNVRRL
jgi:hypothetical protein